MKTVTDFGELLELGSRDAAQFRARTPGDGGHLFGGLTFALAARAAAYTVDDDRVLYAATCQYVSGGSGGLDLTIDVDRVRDGRKLSLRRVSMAAEGRLLFTCDAWFAPEGQPADWQATTPPYDFDDTRPFDIGVGMPIDVIEGRTARLPDDVAALRIHPYWARARERIGEDQTLQLGALAFLSDLYTVGLMAPPVTSPDEPMSDYTITLNHSLWVHRPVDLDEWVRVDGQLTSIHGDRAHSTGSMHAVDGSLIASFAQEAMRRG